MRLEIPIGRRHVRLVVETSGSAVSVTIDFSGYEKDVQQR